MTILCRMTTGTDEPRLEAWERRIIGDT